MPALHAQDGYEGCYVLTTPEGKALVVTFWSDEDAADAGLDERPLRASRCRSSSPSSARRPGRETYDVGIADAPALAGQEAER